MTASPMPDSRRDRIHLWHLRKRAQPSSAAPASDPIGGGVYQPGHWKECEPLAKLSARTREFPSETTTLDSDLVISSDSHRIWRRARSFRSFQASRWRPRPPAYGQGGGAACVMPLRNETYQLQD